jgi:hypothetical protein
VQILLGPKYCQLDQYLMENCILSYKLVTIQQVKNCTLSLSIIDTQSTFLTNARNALTEPNDEKRKNDLE